MGSLSPSSYLRTTIDTGIHSQAYIKDLLSTYIKESVAESARCDPPSAYDMEEVLAYDMEKSLACDVEGSLEYDVEGGLPYDVEGVSHMMWRGS